MNMLSPISLLLVSALVIFSPLQEGGTTHPAQMIIRLLIVTWLGIVLAAGIRAGRLAIPVLTMRYVVLAFVGLALLAAILSPYAHPSRQWLIVIVGYATLFYLLVSFVDRWEHIRRLTIVISNQLVGYGLVVGLAGTGDSDDAVFTLQSMSVMLEKMGVTVNPDEIKVKNVAAVMVTAELPPFARSGSRLDALVNSIGDAKTLGGGTLLMTPLKGADGQVYAVAQARSPPAAFWSARVPETKWLKISRRSAAWFKA